MKHILEISVDIPMFTTGQFQNKLRQQVQIDGSLEIPFNQLLTSLRFMYGNKAIISFKVLLDGTV